jgi:hypothetical protein
VIRPKYEQPTKPTKAEAKAAYEAVSVRSRGICEGCGVQPATEKHHRLYRSRGGHDTTANLLDLCGHGNYEGCHGLAHTAIGEQLGWSVIRGKDPALVPVYRKSDRTWTRDGEPINAIDATEYMLLIGQLKTGLG